MSGGLPLACSGLDVLALLGHDGAGWGWGARLDVTGCGCGIWWGEGGGQERAESRGFAFGNARPLQKCAKDGRPAINLQLSLSEKTWELCAVSGHG